MTKTVRHGWAIKVIWRDGDEEYLMEGARNTGIIARFPSKPRAEAMRRSLLMGMDADVQSVNVVRMPR